MALIQRVPQGLLNLLGLQTLGVNPRDFSDSVFGQLDLERYFIADRIEHVSDILVGATQAGNSANLVVPAGETWRVSAYCVRLTNASGAGAIMHGCVGLNAVASGTPAVATTGMTRRHVSTGDEFITVGVESNIVLTPGNRITGFLVEDVGGALTVNVEVYALISRL